MVRLNSRTQTNRDKELIRVDHKDPERCCHTNAETHRQCEFKRIEGEDYCPKHSIVNSKKIALKNYQLSQYKARVSDFATNPAIKCLREEIGILRLTLENIINLCTNNYDLMLNSSQIATLVDKIDKLVNSCHKLEISNDQLLDRSKALQLADNILHILTEEVKDEDTIGKVAVRIGMLFTNEVENNDT